MRVTYIRVQNIWVQNKTEKVLFLCSTAQHQLINAQI